MTSHNKRPVFVAQRVARRFRWLEAGLAVDRDDGTIDVWLDRMPVGGFSGHILVPPASKRPTENDAPVGSLFEE